jgi:hypothetical protein
MNAAKLLSFACCILAVAGPAFAGDNLVSLTQSQATYPSGGNISTIIQMGSNDFAESNQTGGLNTDFIEQVGNDNSSTVTQKGIGGLVIDIQYGDGNRFSVTQTGINPPPVVITQRP